MSRFFLYGKYLMILMMSQSENNKNADFEIISFWKDLIFKTQLFSAISHISLIYV